MALAVGCIERSEPTPDPRPSPILATAAALGIALPPTPGPDALADGPSLWIARDRVAFTPVDGEEPQTLLTLTNGELDRAAGLGQLGPVYDAADQAFAAVKRERRAINLVVDARVPMATVGHVIDMLSRARADEFHLVSGSGQAPTATTLRWMPVAWDPPPARRPIRDVRLDLGLTWDTAGVRASALPRPADHAPLENGLYEPPPGSDGRLMFPSEVPLRAVDSDLPLDPPAIARLVADLCALNDGPFGVKLWPAPTTSLGDVMAAAIAAVPGNRACRSPAYLAVGHTRGGGPPMALAEVRTYVLAEAARE